MNQEQILQEHQKHRETPFPEMPGTCMADSEEHLFGGGTPPPFTGIPDMLCEP